MVIGLLATVDHGPARGRRSGSSPASSAGDGHDPHADHGLLPRPADVRPRAHPGPDHPGRDRRRTREIVGIRATPVRDRRRHRPHELGVDGPDHPVPDAVGQGADVRRPGPGHRRRQRPHHAPPHPAQRRQPDRRQRGPDVRRRRSSPRRRSSFIGLGDPSPAVVGPDPQRRPGGRRARASAPGGTSSRRPPASSWSSSPSPWSAAPSTTSSTRGAGAPVSEPTSPAPDRSRRRATRRCPPAPRSGAAASGRSPSRPIPDAPLLVVEGLPTHFKLRSARVKAVDGVSFRSTTARRWASPASPAAARRRPRSRSSGSCPPTRRSSAGSVRAVRDRPRAQDRDTRCRRYRWREISIVFQGAMNALNPVQRDRRPDRRADRVSGSGQTRRGARRAGRRAAGAGGHPEGARPGLPARAVGRHAPAGDDRDGPRLRPGDRHRRRADDGPRRHGPGPDPGAPRAASGASSGLSLILITHDLSVIAETCDRVMVMYAGPGGRGGAGPPGLHGAAPPVHPDAAGAPSRTSTRTGATLETIPGSPPDLRDAAAGLPVPAALPGGDGRLPRRRCRRRCASRTASASPATSTRRAATVRRRRRPSSVPPVRRRRRGAAPRDGRRDGDELLRLEGLAGPLPGPGRPRRTRSRRRRGGYVRAVDGIDLTIRRGRGPGARRGVRARARRRPGGSSSSSPGRPPAGSSSTARTSPDAVGRRRAARLPAPGPAHLPGPVRDAEPEADDPRLRGRAAGGPPDRRDRPPSASSGCIEALEAAGLRPAADFALPLPARALGRPAAAGRHRRGARDGPGARRRRRAGVSMLDVSIRTELLRLMLDLRARARA